MLLTSFFISCGILLHMEWMSAPNGSSASTTKSLNLTHPTHLARHLHSIGHDHHTNICLQQPFISQSSSLLLGCFCNQNLFWLANFECCLDQVPVKLCGRRRLSNHCSATELVARPFLSCCTLKEVTKFSLNVLIMVFR